MDALLEYDSASDEDDKQSTTARLGKRSLDQQELSVKKQALPKLPSLFSSIITPTGTSSQDHQGRTRTRQGKINNWATYVYIQVPLGDEIQGILDAVTANNNNIHNMTQADRGFHLSLTKCLYLKEHQLEEFSNAVRTQLQDTPRFTMSFAQLSILSNEDNTRSFLTAEVGAGYNDLMAKLKKVDQVVTKFHHPEFYKPPRFHASIAWSLQKMPLDQAIKTLPEKWMNELAFVEYSITSIYVKMGNRIVTVKLK
ncbi:U6 snRNA phosphodiesterase Usb1 [Absidia repens]|uniref:U6 snRNA phosphodiesterase 1 n=1 Tax=Absidia repens TaxID=90262 RepID=A0A1X2IZE2_9FUNG|nr:U6 snRNA phosphodiesterase Usb1 [Absidia repens]